MERKEAEQRGVGGGVIETETVRERVCERERQRARV